MSLEKFSQELEKYCDEDQFEVFDNRIELRTNKIGKLELLEHLTEAVHPHNLKVSHNGDITLKEGNPVQGNGDIETVLERNSNVIDRDKYEQRFVEKEWYKDGGDEIYLILGKESKEQIVSIFIECLKCGYYPAGYDLQRGSERNQIMFGKPAN